LEESVKTPFRPIALITLVLLVALGTFDTASAQNTISLTPTTLVFCVATNSSESPPPQILTVSAANGAGSQDFDASATQSWILLNGEVTPPSISGNTTTSPIISVQIDPSGYATGTTHTGLIQITAGSTGSGTANVTINVSNSCAAGSGTLNPNPITVHLTPTLPSQKVQISGSAGSAKAVPNYGNGPSGWFVLDNSSFNSPSFNVNVSLTATPSNVSYSGSVTITVNGTTNAVTIT